MSRLITALGILLVLAGCEKDVSEKPSEPGAAVEETEPEKPVPAEPGPAAEEVVTMTGEFGPQGKQPVREGEPKIVDIPPKVVEALNSEAAERLTVVAHRHGVEGLKVELGGGGANGLRMVVKRGDEQVEVHVPPATNPAEAVTNLDHTFDRALRELAR
jgi:hypothetical protein